jgi:ATP-dependent helicase HrpB
MTPILSGGSNAGAESVDSGQKLQAGIAMRWVATCTLDVNGQIGGGRRLGCAIALAFPIASPSRRDASGENWLSVGGRGYRLDAAHPLAKEEWLAVADIQGAASGARILSAAAIDFSEIEALYGDRIVSGAHAAFDPASGVVRTESGRRLGAIIAVKGAGRKGRSGCYRCSLLQGVRDHGLDLLPWSESSIRLRERALLGRGFGTE